MTISKGEILKRLKEYVIFRKLSNIKHINEIKIDLVSSKDL